LVVLVVVVVVVVVMLVVVVVRDEDRRERVDVPRTYAISWLNSTEGEARAAAIACVG
jgi:heme/copper-type cytochrome/quinol oxidase subunit 2